MADQTFTFAASAGNLAAVTARIKAQFASVSRSARAAMASTAASFGAAAKKIQQSTMVAELETISALFIQVGGNTSRFASIVTSLIRPMAILKQVGISPVAAGIAALVISLPIASLAMLKLASASANAVDRLKEVAHVTSEQRAATEAYRDAADSLSIAVDKLTAALGEGLLETASDVSHMFIVLADSFRAFKIATQGVRDTAWQLNRVLAEGFTLGIAPRVENATASIIGMGEESSKTTQEVKELVQAAIKLGKETAKFLKDDPFVAQGPTFDPTAQRNAQMSAARAEQAAGERAFAEEVAAAEAKIRVALADSRLELMKTKPAFAEFRAHIKKTEADQDRFYRAVVKNYGKVPGLLKDLDQLQTDLENAHAEAVKELIVGTIDYLSGVANGAMDLIGGFLDAQLQREEEIAQKRAANEDRLENKLKDLRQKRRSAETAEARARIQSEIEETRFKESQAENRRKAAEREARKTFFAVKALQITQTAINAAATFGIVMATSTAPAPFNAIAAGAASASVAAQIPIIAAKKPPKFHTGGATSQAPDEIVMTALRNEGVASPRGMQRLGGEQGLRRLNEDRDRDKPMVLHATINIDGKQVAKETVRLTKSGKRNTHADR